MSTIAPYTGDGSTTQFDITFDYRIRASIRLRVNGVDVPFSFVNDSRVQAVSPPPAGSLVEVYRSTPVSEPEVSFTDIQILQADDLNKLGAQPRDRIEEVASEVSSVFGRAIRAPYGEDGGELPPLAERAGRYLAFDAGGKPIPASPSPDGSSTALRADLASDGAGAALIRYQATVGYSFGTVGEKLRQAPGITDHGAVGDGVADDTYADAIGRASLRARGGGVFVYPPGAGYRIKGRKRSPGMLIEEADFPPFAGLEPNISFGVYTRNNGEGNVGKAGVYSFMVNGTGNMVPFSTVGGRDCVALSGVVYSGEDAPNPVCVANFISRYAGLPPGINWCLEIDVNNESPEAYTRGDARGGQGLVLNTGSTYMPDSGIVIQRGTGEGTGPGFKRGIGIIGAREVGIQVLAMHPAAHPGMNPAAPGTITAFSAGIDNEAYNRFTISERGAMVWTGGDAPLDIELYRSGPNAMELSGVLGVEQLYCQGENVVGPRQGAIANATAGTEAATINAILAALRTHGLIEA